MKRQKRKGVIIATILVIASLASSFAGCDSTDETTSDVSGTESISKDTGVEDEDNDSTVSTDETVIIPEDTESSPEETTVSDTESSETESSDTESSDTESSDTTSVGTTQPEDTESTSSPTHTHTFGQWSETAAPTCTKEGERVRTCKCGEKETEVVPKVGHDYKNGICRFCNSNKYSGDFKIINVPGVTSVQICNADIIVLETSNGVAMYNKEGKRISDYYQYIQSPSVDGYCVATNIKEENLGEVVCNQHGEMLTLYRETFNTYVLDSNGKVVFQKIGIQEDENGHDTGYTGEIIAYCDEGRIISYTYEKYSFPMAYSERTLHIYDINGKKIADIENVASFGNYMNGKMFVQSGLLDYLYAYDKQCNKIGSVDLEMLNLSNGHVSIATGFHTSFFANKFISIMGYDKTLLLGEDLKTTYVLNRAYAKDLNYGTLVFSRVVENGKASDEYYLIDVSKCAKDSNGMVIPSKSAAVCNTPFKDAFFDNHYGKIEKYALINTTDGKWGYVSYDGKITKLYDDVTSFSNGIAAVKEGEEIYIINDKLERISNGITGYDSVSAPGDGVFVLQKGDKLAAIAVYSK